MAVSFFLYIKRIIISFTIFIRQIKRFVSLFLSRISSFFYSSVFFLPLFISSYHYMFNFKRCVKLSIIYSPTAIHGTEGEKKKKRTSTNRPICSQ